MATYSVSQIYMCVCVFICLFVGSIYLPFPFADKIAQLVECLLGIHETLGSILYNTKQISSHMTPTSKLMAI